MIVNDDQSGNYLVTVYARKKRVSGFQTRTRDDAIEEAWKIYLSRKRTTTRITGSVSVCRIWKRPGRGFKVTDLEDITDEMLDRWNALCTTGDAFGSEASERDCIRSQQHWSR